MAPISFSLYGYEYASEICVIEKTYTVSRQALHDQKYAIYAQFEAIRRDELEDFRDPESGEPSLSDKLDYELGQIESARQNLCQAVLVMLYHFWEKQVLFWAVNLKGKDRHECYVDFCEGVGLKVEKDHLELLRCLTNFVKHGQGNSEWGNRFQKLNSKLFPETSNAANSTDYPDLTDAHVLKIFQAVTESGPDVLSNFHPSKTTP